MQDITHLVTHSGMFHADDVCAAVVLTTLFADAEIVRTRDSNEIARLAPNAIIFDVGDVYDPAQRKFDHHQTGRELRPGTKIPFSSFGLIWAEYGMPYIERVLAPDVDDLAGIWLDMNMSFVRNIDALDNGVFEEGDEGLLHNDAFASLINDFRPDFDACSDAAELASFRAAMTMARTIIDNKLRMIAAARRANAMIKDAIETRKDPRWIELPYSMAFDEVVHESGAEDILFAIYPKNDVWLLNVVRKDPRFYPARKDLPANWGGLRGAELEAQTGVEGSTFCHSALFLAEAKSRDAIMAMLQIALDN